MEKRSEVRVTKTPGKIPTTVEEFQQEKITRREALRRIGITTGAGLFMMLGIDDLARLASRKLAEHKEFGEVGETVAREFRDAGAAFAGTPSNPSSPSSPSHINNCTWCETNYTHDKDVCQNAGVRCARCSSIWDAQLCQDALTMCLKQALDKRDYCRQINNC